MRRHRRAGLDLTALAGDDRRRRDGFVGDRSPANERDDDAASGSVVRGKGRVGRSRKKAAGWAGFRFALLVGRSEMDKGVRPTGSLGT
jgi:hypothetical protein